MLLRLLRLCGELRCCWPVPTATRRARRPTLTQGLHTHTGRAAYNAQMAGAIRAAGLPVAFITPASTRGA